MSGLLISTETTFCLCSKNRIRRKLRRAPTNSPTRAAASLATIEKTGFRRNATCANRRAEGLRHCGIVSLGKTQHLSANRSVQDIVRATRSVIDLVGRCLRQPRTRPCSRAPGPSVLSPDDSHEVQFEGRVHGAKRLAGEIDRARLPEHVLGEDVDASPSPPPRDRTRRGPSARAAPGRSPAQVLERPGRPRSSSPGEVLAQRLMEHLRLDGNRGQKKRCDDHRRTTLPRFGFVTVSRLDGSYSSCSSSRASWFIDASLSTPTYRVTLNASAPHVVVAEFGGPVFLP